MNSTLEEKCRLAVELEDKTEHLEHILRELKADPSLSSCVWEYNYFPITILQIFTNAFYLLNTKNFTIEENYKVTVCMEILQILLEDKVVKNLFLDSRFEYYIFPFLLTSSEDMLRISTLKVFCVILSDGTINNLSGTELLPILLRSVDSGSEEQQQLSLTALSYVFRGKGLDYAVQTIDRFQAIDVVLGSLVARSIQAKNTSILKKLIDIYIKLCEKPNVRQKVKEKMPEGIESKEILHLCAQDEELCEIRRRFLSMLQ